MISTPDAVLQAVIKRALIESNCPSQLITELMENAHERRWPPGLCTLETRQQNRRLYETIICKRIPGKPNRVCCCSTFFHPLHVTRDISALVRIWVFWPSAAMFLDQTRGQNRCQWSDWRTLTSVCPQNTGYQMKMYSSYLSATSFSMKSRIIFQKC